MSEIAEQLTCQELVELVTDYLEGALPPPERERFDAHIAGCDRLPRYLEQIGAHDPLPRARSRPRSSDAEAESGLLEAFRDWKRRP